MLRAEFIAGCRLFDHDGREILMPVRKSKALFAYLALKPGKQYSRAELADLLWDAATENRARQSLRRCLLDLRRALGKAADQVLCIEAETIGLAEGAVKTDIGTLRCLAESGMIDEAAASLTDGELLQGLEVKAESFDDWLSQERHLHREMAAEMLFANATRLAKVAQSDLAIDAAKRCLGFDPYHEEAHRLLIDLYVKVGKLGSARRQYDGCIKALRLGLDAEPSTETQATAVGIDASLRWQNALMKPVVSVRTFDHLDTELTEAAKTFGAGLSEDVVCELSRYRWISLVTDGTTRGYQVDGSVRLSNSRYRIVLRLATAPNGHLLWCETFDCETSNMLDAQRTLAQSAVSRIMAQIEQNEQQTRPPVAAEQTAYWLWQQGKAQLFQFTSASNAQAKRSLLHAIKLDPEFVPAYVAMSNADQMDAFFNYSGARHECLMSGMSMAKTAIDIDASDALAHLALGKVLIRTMDVDEAAVELEIARNLCPSLAEAHYASGVALYYAGQPKRALPYVERSIELDPLGPRMWCMRHLMARCLFDLGKFDEALHWARQAVNSPNSKSIALALKAAAARKAGYKGLAIQTVGDLRKKDPRMTSQYLVENLGNERIRDRVDDLAETLSKCGLPE